MHLIQSPAPLPDSLAQEDKTVFLAGTIDMGKSILWQATLIESLASCPGVILNPRRDYWSPDWPADSTFPLFRQQVEWELQAMTAAKLIAFYFSPGSQAPVTLLELGLAAQTQKAVVCCPPGYWRKGNVDIVCEHYGIPRVDTLDDLAAAIHDFCGSSGNE